MSLMSFILAATFVYGFVPVVLRLKIFKETAHMRHFRYTQQPLELIFGQRSWGGDKPILEKLIVRLIYFINALVSIGSIIFQVWYWLFSGIQGNIYF